MEIKAIAGNIAEIKADAIIVNFFEEMLLPDYTSNAEKKVLNGAISQLISQG